MNDTNVIFCGLSKNSFKTLKKNIEFIEGFRESQKDKNIYTLIVDSDSTDGSKEFLKDFKENIRTIHKDDIDKISSSRIERISKCRNLCLDYIEKNLKNKNLIYIPCDMDLDLFARSTFDEINSYIELTIKSYSEGAIFPVSVPFYYDVFALRAKGWLNFNSQLILSKIKQYLKLGSFILNYIFIFRYQWSLSKIKRKNFNVRSAFGGIGIYNISNKDLSTCRYETSNKDKDYYSEHLFFNSHFQNLTINSDWLIEAPFQHIEYRSYGLMKKIKYILRTVKYDFRNLIKRIN